MKRMFLILMVFSLLPHTVLIAKATRVAPGYLFELSHGEDEKLNGKFRVSFNGVLTLPYKIKIYAKGLTLKQLRNKVTKAYKPFFRISGPVKWRILEDKVWVDIQGLVQKPGRYLIDHSSSLDEARSVAGGYLVTEQPDYVRIISQKNIRTLHLDDINNYKIGTLSKRNWKGGETVLFKKLKKSPMADYISHQRNISVLGAVTAPGNQTFIPGADFIYYLTKSGGPSGNANLKDIILIRNYGNGTKKELRFNLSETNKIPFPISGDVFIVSVIEDRTFDTILGRIGTITSIIASAIMIVMLID